MSSQTRDFGGKTFNAVGYGGMGLSIAYGTVGTDEERFKVVFTSPILVVGGWLTSLSQVLDAVYESGCTFWDTADAYGDNEELIGKWYVPLNFKLSSPSSAHSSRFDCIGSRRPESVTRFSLLQSLVSVMQTPRGP